MSFNWTNLKIICFFHNFKPPRSIIIYLDVFDVNDGDFTKLVLPVVLVNNVNEQLSDSDNDVDISCDWLDQVRGEKQTDFIVPFNAEVVFKTKFRFIGVGR